VYRSIQYYCTCYNIDFQNASSDELLEMVTRLVERAVAYSQDETYLSPLAHNGSRTLSWNYIGGKVDDITAIVSIVREEAKIKQAMHA